jgi:antigen 43
MIINVTSGETIYVSGGVDYISSGGVNVSSFTTFGADDTIAVASGGTASGLTLSTEETLVAANGAVSDNITIGNGGTLSISATSATVTGISILSGGLLEVRGGNVTNPVTVVSGGEIALAAAGYSLGDTVTVTSTSLTVLGSGSRAATQTIALNSGGFTVTSGDAAAPFASSELVTFVTCFKGGTEILTDRGAVPIETIRADDNVVVRRNGEAALEPVAWVGSSLIDLTRHARPELAAPIRVKAGALAENTPVRDLLVSPEHCLILDGLCVPAKLLVNGGSIAREYPTAPFQYYHLELEQHGILIAEGAEAESYLDTGNRSLFDNADVPRMLHPTFEVDATSDRWKTDACAPLAAKTEDVAPIWQALSDRSTALGFVVVAPPMVEDPDLHILADGQRIQPVSDRDSCYVFMVPAGVRTVSLSSRFAIPADKMVSNVRDTRRLGVSVNSIAIRSGNSDTVLSADHPELRDGWNAVEQEGATMWRWTNGAAMIPWDNIAGAAVLTVRCIPADLYPVHHEALALVA